MNKKLFVLLPMFALMLAGCSGSSDNSGGNTPTPTPTPTVETVDSVEISRTELELEVGKAFSLSAAAKPSTLSDRSVVWSSDDAEVASVNDSGRVTANAEGEATIRAAAKLDATKYAECKVTVVGEIEAISVAEALEEAGKLEEGGVSADTYKIEGYVTGIQTPYSAQYGNISFTIADEVGGEETLLVYRLKVSEEEAAKILVDAKVVLEAKLKNYNGTLETNEGGTLVSAEGGHAAQVIEATVAEALAVELAENAVTADEYQVTGIVKNITTAYDATYGNISFNITDEADETKVMLVYRMTCTEEEAAKILVNAKVVVKGNIKNYKGANQLNQGCVLISAEGGDVPPEPSVIEATLAEALEIAGALEDKTSTTDIYKVTAKVTEIVTAYNAQYGNISFNLGEEGVEGVLQAYRLTCTAEEAAKIVVGATATVQGHLKKYGSTLEFDAGCTLVSISGGDVPPEPSVIEATVAEALAVIDALEDNGVTTEKYKVSGVVVSAEAYSTQYSNVTFKMGDTVDAAEVLTVFRWSTTAEEAAKLLAGAEVTVVATLQKYVKNGNATPETKVIESVEIGESGVVPPEPQPIDYGSLESPLSVATLLDNDGTICAKTNGSFSEEKVVVKGVIKSATYSSEYGTYTGYLADEADASRTIKFTGVRLDTTLAEAVEEYDIVVLEHYLEYYNGEYSLYYKKDSENNRLYGDFLAVTKGEKPEPQPLSFELVPGTSASMAKVNNQDAVKVGTSGADGNMTIKVSADVKTITLHAAAWKAKAGTISVSAPEGVTVDQTELTLAADDGISNNSPFTLAGAEEDYVFTLELSGLTAETSITLASGTARRFVVWGVTVA